MINKYEGSSAALNPLMDPADKVFSWSGVLVPLSLSCPSPCHITTLHYFLIKRNRKSCDIAETSGGTARSILCSEIKGFQCKSLPFQCSPVRYEGSQSDWILLATNGDVQAINAGSSIVHINLHSAQNLHRRKGKMFSEQPCPVKNHCYKSISHSGAIPQKVNKMLLFSPTFHTTPMLSF